MLLLYGVSLSPSLQLNNLKVTLSAAYSVTLYWILKDSLTPIPCAVLYLCSDGFCGVVTR